MIASRSRSASNRACFATLVVSLGVAGAASAHAFAYEPGTEPGSAIADEAPASAVVAQLPNRRALTLAEAVVIAQSRHPGRVVSAQTVQQGNGAVHEVRIIGTDGVVHAVRIDARTGAVQ